MISHRIWNTRFGGQDVVGQQLRSAGDSFTIVGVAPREFDFPRDVDVWLPLRVGWAGVEQQTHLRVFRSIGRLKQGVGIAQLRAQMSVVARQMAQVAPAGSSAYGVQVTPMLDEIFGNARVAIWTISGAVLLVLLIACANAANLLLARATLRRRELAVRAALGAGRAQLIRLLLMDGVVLATLAGTAGLLLAKLGIGVIARMAPPDIPLMSEVTLNPSVLLFGVGLSFATIFAFALAPAWMASKRNPLEAFQQSASRMSSGRSQARMREGLIVLEVAVSIVLLVGAGLLMRSFNQLAQLDPGFNAERILTFRVTLAKPDQESRRAFYGQLLERLRALPGVESAGAVLLRPLSGNVGWDTVYGIEGQPPEEQLRNPNANYEAVSAAYFRTMGIQLLAGRDFAATDVHTASGVVIVNESTAERHWRGRSAVGQHLRLGKGPQQPWLTVVGVVNDVRYREWEAVRPDLYVPYTQRAQHRSDFVIKTHKDPAGLIAAVRREVFTLDQDQAVSNVTNMSALVDRALARSRFNSALLSVLASCALVLAVIGLFGVLSYTIAQRRGEMAIRLAVGASPGRLAGMIASYGLKLSLYGTAIGLIGAGVISRLLTSLLFGIDAFDPLTYSASVLGLLAVAAIACVLPALQAARLDPVKSLQ